MYARITLLEIDTLRVAVGTAVDLFVREIVPRLREQPGYCGVHVLTTPEGKALLMSLWATERDADASAETGFYADLLAEYAALFRAPPGRERYEVAFEDSPAHAPR